jgi:hypothetical protein
MCADGVSAEPFAGNQYGLRCRQPWHILPTARSPSRAGAAAVRACTPGVGSPSAVGWLQSVAMISDLLDAIVAVITWPFRMVARLFEAIFR